MGAKWSEFAPHDRGLFWSIYRALAALALDKSTPRGRPSPTHAYPRAKGTPPRGPSEYFVEGHSLSSRIATCSRQCQALRHSCTLEDSAGHCSHSAGQSQAAAAVTARPLTRTKGEGHPPPQGPLGVFHWVGALSANLFSSSVSWRAAPVCCGQNRPKLKDRGHKPFYFAGGADLVRACVDASGVIMWGMHTKGGTR